MAGGMPDEGEEDILDVILATTLVLRLFKNNFSPVNASVLSDFTEADFTGYSSVSLTGGSWTTTQGAPSTATYAQQAFTGTGAAQTVYGYYITRTSSGRVWYYQRFTTPISVGSSTPVLRISPALSMKDSVD